MTAQLAVTALRTAGARRQPTGVVVVQSDRASQFRARSFRAVLTATGLQGSMGRVASAGDNAAMESWHPLLQKNVLDGAAGAPASSCTRRSCSGPNTPTTAADANESLAAHAGRVRAPLRRPGRSRRGMNITHPVSTDLQQSRTGGPGLPEDAHPSGAEPAQRAVMVLLPASTGLVVGPTRVQGSPHGRLLARRSGRCWSTCRRRGSRCP